MSFFSEINGLNAKAMKNLQEAENKNNFAEDDFSNVDFCQDDKEISFAETTNNNEKHNSTISVKVDEYNYNDNDKDWTMNIEG